MRPFLRVSFSVIAVAALTGIWVVFSHARTETIPATPVRPVAGEVPGGVNYLCPGEGVREYDSPPGLTLTSVALTGLAFLCVVPARKVRS